MATTFPDPNAFVNQMNNGSLNTGTFNGAYASSIDPSQQTFQSSGLLTQQFQNEQYQYPPQPLQSEVPTPQYSTMGVTATNVGSGEFRIPIDSFPVPPTSTSLTTPFPSSSPPQSDINSGLESLNLNAQQIQSPVQHPRLPPKDETPTIKTTVSYLKFDKKKMVGIKPETKTFKSEGKDMKYLEMKIQYNYGTVESPLIAALKIIGPTVVSGYGLYTKTFTNKETGVEGAPKTNFSFTLSPVVPDQRRFLEVLTEVFWGLVDLIFDNKRDLSEKFQTFDKKNPFMGISPFTGKTAYEFDKVVTLFPKIKGTSFLGADGQPMDRFFITKKKITGIPCIHISHIYFGSTTNAQMILSSFTVDRVPEEPANVEEQKDAIDELKASGRASEFSTAMKLLTGTSAEAKAIFDKEKKAARERFLAKQAKKSGIDPVTGQPIQGGFTQGNQGGFPQGGFPQGGFPQPGFSGQTQFNAPPGANQFGSAPFNPQMVYQQPPQQQQYQPPPQAPQYQQPPQQQYQQPPFQQPPQAPQQRPQSTQAPQVVQAPQYQPPPTAQASQGYQSNLPPPPSSGLPHYAPSQFRPA